MARKNRKDFHNILVDLLGSRNVYYQPPDSVQIKYPAIVYRRASIEHDIANNRVYRSAIAYEVILITKDPDSEYVMALSELPYSDFNRHYTYDNLNHDVFTIYY